jgi:hypothetical protein
MILLKYCLVALNTSNSALLNLQMLKTLIATSVLGFPFPVIRGKLILVTGKWISKPLLDSRLSNYTTTLSNQFKKMADEGMTEFKF